MNHEIRPEIKAEFHLDFLLFLLCVQKIHYIEKCDGRVVFHEAYRSVFAHKQIGKCTKQLYLFCAFTRPMVHDIIQSQETCCLASVNCFK